MEDVLKNAGFEFVSKCSCGGTLTKTWSKNANGKKCIVKERPNRQTFEIRIWNTRITTGYAEQLAEKLIEYELI